MWICLMSCVFVLWDFVSNRATEYLPASWTLRFLDGYYIVVSRFMCYGAHILQGFGCNIICLMYLTFVSMLKMTHRNNHIPIFCFSQCLYDVCIEAEDHSIIQCHKCVLVARLDYFRSMLSSGWIEVRAGITTKSIFFLNIDMWFFLYNCGIRHVTVPIATRILIANVRHIGLSNICVINLVYFKMQVWCLWNRYKATVMLNCIQYVASRLK